MGDAASSQIWNYVMDGAGGLYIAASKSKNDFNHSYFLSGAPVAAAGEIMIKEGKVISINNKSGQVSSSAPVCPQLPLKLKNSQLARKYGFQYLKHWTPCKNLPDILNSGKLVPKTV